MHTGFGPDWYYRLTWLERQEFVKAANKRNSGK